MQFLNSVLKQWQPGVQLVQNNNKTFRVSNGDGRTVDLLLDVVVQLFVVCCLIRSHCLKEQIFELDFTYKGNMYFDVSCLKTKLIVLHLLDFDNNYYLTICQLNKM